MSLQSLVNHTVRRIVELQKECFVNINEDPITAIYKWRYDGSSGHSTYRQRFSDAELLRIDENIFAVCIVPFQIKMGDFIQKPLN